MKASYFPLVFGAWFYKNEFLIKQVNYLFKPINFNASSNVGDEKALGVTTIIIREAGASIKISSTIAKDKAVEADTIATVEADTIVTMEVTIITGSSTTIKISGRDSRTMAMVAKIILSLTSSEL